MKIGTSKNPIKLVSESTPRSLLLKHSKNTANGVFDFHALPGSGEDVYIRNVLFNQHLTLQEVKLAVYFFEALPDGGKVFSTSLSTSIYFANTYGELVEFEGEIVDVLVIGSVDQEDQNSYGGSFDSLSILTTSMGMKLTSQQLTNLVRRLHDFGYITVTDITPKNTYNPPKSNNGQQRARLRHIRLCKGMCKKSMESRWLPKKRVKHKKKTTSSKPKPG